jgi:hypothetical protein
MIQENHMTDYNEYFEKTVFRPTARRWSSVEPTDRAMVADYRTLGETEHPDLPPSEIISRLVDGE